MHLLSLQPCQMSQKKGSNPHDFILQWRPSARKKEKVKSSIFTELKVKRWQLQFVHGNIKNWCSLRNTSWKWCSNWIKEVKLKSIILQDEKEAVKQLIVFGHFLNKNSAEEKRFILTLPLYIYILNVTIHFILWILRNNLFVVCLCLKPLFWPI